MVGFVHAALRRRLGHLQVVVLFESAVGCWDNGEWLDDLIMLDDLILGLV